MRLILISGRKVLDDTMHRTGMFEPFKALAWPEAVDISTETKPEELLPEIRKLAVEDGTRVVALFVPHNPAGAWVDPTVKCISNGNQWCMLDKVLDAYGYVEPAKVTDEEVAP